MNCRNLKMVDNFLSPVLKKDFNPAWFLTPVLPPITVPSEDFKEWTDDDERVFAFWQGEKGSKYTKEDYMDFLHSINNEFNREEVFVKLEEGLEAFGKLLSCMKQFPNYNFIKDLDEAYTLEENVIMKEFFKFGVKFVKKREVGVKKFLSFVKKYDIEADESVQLSQLVDSMDEIEKVSNTDRDQEIVDKAVDLVTVAEASNNNPESPVVEELTAVDRSKRRKKSKRSKEKRQDRLLRFHQKLVEVSGLPPSRLMLEQTPKSSMDLVKLNRRRLDFGVDSNNCDLMPGKQEPPQPQIKQPGAVTSLGSNGAGTTSNLNCNAMLCSSSTGPPQVSSSGGCAWSEARPVVGQRFVGSNFLNYSGRSDASPLWVTEWNNPRQGSIGVFSGYMNKHCCAPVL